MYTIQHDVDTIHYLFVCELMWQNFSNDTLHVEHFSQNCLRESSREIAGNYPVKNMSQLF